MEGRQDQQDANSKLKKRAMPVGKIGQYRSARDRNGLSNYRFDNFLLIDHSSLIYQVSDKRKW